MQECTRKSKGAQGQLDAELQNGFDERLAWGYVCRGSWWLSPTCTAFGDAWWDECAVVIDDGWYPKVAYSAMSVLGMRVAVLTNGYSDFIDLVTAWT